MSDATPSRFLRPAEAAKYLNVSLSFLNKARLTGAGPRFRKPTRRVILYAIGDLDAWVGRALASTSAGGAA